MNIFSLFESKDIESVKLGIEVIKTLNKEKEFEDKMGISFEKYEDIFNNILLVVNKKDETKAFVDVLFYRKFDLSKISKFWIEIVIMNYPELINYFDLTKLESSEIYGILLRQPHLINNLDLTKLNNLEITSLLCFQPHLKHYLKKNGIKCII